MRTHTIDNTTIEYPDQIGFCFNPVIINILGGNVSIRPRACFFPLFSFLPLWLHYNLNPLCV